MDEKTLLVIIFWWGVAWMASGLPALMMSIAAVFVAHFTARGRFDLAEVARAAMMVAVFADAFHIIIFSTVRRRNA